MSDSSRDYDSNGSRKSLRNRLQSMQSTDRTDAKKGQHLSDLTKNIGNTLQSIFSNKSDSSVYSKGVRELDNFGYEKYNLEDDGGEIFISKVPERAMFNDGEPIIVRATAGNFVGSSDNTTARIELNDVQAPQEEDYSWAGRETTCPACSERVVISPDAPTPATRISAAPAKESADSMQKPEPAVSSEKRRDSGKEFNGKPARVWRMGGCRKYIWGRLYISSIWILVGLVLIAGICTIVFSTSHYNTEKNLRREALWKNIPLLQEKQTAFLEHLEDTIDLLAEKKQLGTKNQPEVTGFQLPDSIRRKEFVFNEELDSIESVEESIATMEECIQTIRALESGLEKNLEDQLRGLQSLIRGAASRSRTVAPLTGAISSPPFRRFGRMSQRFRAFILTIKSSRMTLTSSSDFSISSRTICSAEVSGCSWNSSTEISRHSRTRPPR